MEIRVKLMDEQGLMWNGMPRGVSNREKYEDNRAELKDAMYFLCTYLVTVRSSRIGISP